MTIEIETHDFTPVFQCVKCWHRFRAYYKNDKPGPCPVCGAEWEYGKNQVNVEYLNMSVKSGCVLDEQMP